MQLHNIKDHYTLDMGCIISKAAVILQGYCHHTLDIGSVIFKAFVAILVFNG